MKVFLVLMLALFAGEAAVTIGLEAGKPRPPLSATTIGVIAILDLAIVVWAASLLVTSA